MRIGYRITLSVLTIMILMTISIGTSYSYYAVSSTQKTPNFISTSCFEISFEEEDSINLDKAYPMSEHYALSKLKPYKFIVNNTCTTENANDNIKYVLTLNTINEKVTDITYLNHKYLNHKLLATKDNQENYTKSSGLIKDLTMLGEEEFDMNIKNSIGAEIDTSYSLDFGTLLPGESVEYSLYLWIDENACDNNKIIDSDTNETECEKYVMAKSFEGKIAVYAYM